MSRSKHNLSVPVRERVLANFQAEAVRVGLPRVVLARKLEVAEKQIHNWISGRNAPNYESVEKFAPFFGREPDWFYLDHSEDEVAA